LRIARKIPHGRDFPVPPSSGNDVRLKGSRGRRGRGAFSQPLSEKTREAIERDRYAPLICMDRPSPPRRRREEGGGGEFGGTDAISRRKFSLANKAAATAINKPRGLAGGMRLVVRSRSRLVIKPKRAVRARDRKGKFGRITRVSELTRFGVSAGALVGRNDNRASE